MPQNIYDDEAFFEGYSQYPRSRHGLVAAPEWPTLRSMLPPVAGLRVLDLGCGFGAFARWASEAGAASVLGLDLSEKMLERAQVLTPYANVTLRRADISQIVLPEASFDLVYSSLALHYIEDFDAVCAAVRHVLTDSGHFVFSVEHPIFTAPGHPGWQTNTDGDMVWPVNQYAIEGKRITDWIASGVVKQHRTIASYINSLLAHDFQLSRLIEWHPTEEQISEHPDWIEHIHRPMFLLLAAHL